MFHHPLRHPFLLNLCSDFSFFFLVICFLSNVLCFAGKHMCVECVSLLFSGCWIRQLIVLLGVNVYA